MGQASANKSVSKASVPGAMKVFVPCGVVAVDMNERPDLIRETENTLKLGWGRKLRYMKLNDTRTYLEIDRAIS